MCTASRKIHRVCFVSVLDSWTASSFSSRGQIRSVLLSSLSADVDEAEVDFVDEEGVLQDARRRHPHPQDVLLKKIQYGIDALFKKRNSVVLRYSLLCAESFDLIVAPYPNRMTSKTNLAESS